MSARNSSDKKALKRRMFDNQKVRGYGGEWMQSNLGFACSKCNSAKGAMVLEEFLT